MLMSSGLGGCPIATGQPGVADSGGGGIAPTPTPPSHQATNINPKPNTTSGLNATATSAIQCPFNHHPSTPAALHFRLPTCDTRNVPKGRVYKTVKLRCEERGLDKVFDVLKNLDGEERVCVKHYVWLNEVGRGGRWRGVVEGWLKSNNSQSGQSGKVKGGKTSESPKPAPAIPTTTSVGGVTKSRRAVSAGVPATSTTPSTLGGGVGIQKTIRKVSDSAIPSTPSTAIHGNGVIRDGMTSTSAAPALRTRMSFSNVKRGTHAVSSSSGISSNATSSTANGPTPLSTSRSKSTKPVIKDKDHDKDANSDTASVASDTSASTHTTSNTSIGKTGTHGRMTLRDRSAPIPPMGTVKGAKSVQRMKSEGSLPSHEQTQKGGDRVAPMATNIGNRATGASRTSSSSSYGSVRSAGKGRVQSIAAIFDGSGGSSSSSMQKSGGARKVSGAVEADVHGENEMLRARVAELEHEMRRREEVGLNAETRVRDLTQQVEEMQHAYQIQEAELAETILQRDVVATVRDELMQEVLSLKRQVDVLNTSRDSDATTHTQPTQEDMTCTIDELVRKLESAKLETDAIREELVSVTAKRDGLEVTCQELARELKRMENRETDGVRKVEVLEAEVVELRKLLKESESREGEVTRLRELVLEYEQKIKTLEGDKVELRAEGQSLRKELDDVRREMEEWVSRGEHVVKLETEYQNLKTENERFAKELQEIKDAHLEATNRGDTYQANNERLSREIGELKSAKENVDNRLETLLADYQKLKEDIGQLQQNPTSHEEDKDSRQEKDAEIHSLQKRVAELNRNFQDSQHEITSLRRSEAAALLRRDELLKARDELHKELDDTRSRVDLLAKQLAQRPVRTLERKKALSIDTRSVVSDDISQTSSDLKSGESQGVKPEECIQSPSSYRPPLTLSRDAWVLPEIETRGEDSLFARFASPTQTPTADIEVSTVPLNTTGHGSVASETADEESLSYPVSPRPIRHGIRSMASTPDYFRRLPVRGNPPASVLSLGFNPPQRSTSAPPEHDHISNALKARSSADYLQISPTDALPALLADLDDGEPSEDFLRGILGSGTADVDLSTHVLDLSGQHMPVFPPQPSGPLASLTTRFATMTHLYLGDNNLAAFPTCLVDEAPGLLVLDLSRNRIQSLSGDVGKLVNLRELYLDENFIVEMEDGIGQLKNLEVCDLSYNQLPWLPAGMFVHMERLEYLDLTRNRLRSLPPSLGLTHRTLKALFLGENSWESTFAREKLGGLLKLQVPRNNGRAVTPSDRTQEAEKMLRRIAATRACKQHRVSFGSMFSNGSSVMVDDEMGRDVEILSMSIDSRRRLSGYDSGVSVMMGRSSAGSQPGGLKRSTTADSSMTEGSNSSSEYLPPAEFGSRLSSELSASLIEELARPNRTHFHGEAKDAMLRLLQFLRDVYELDPSLVQHQLQIVGAFNAATQPMEDGQVVHKSGGTTTNSSKRDKIVAEMVATEKTYVRELENLVEIYQTKILKEGWLTAKEIDLVFHNIKSILAIHRDHLLPGLLKSSQATHQPIGSVFLSIAPFLKMYSSYYNNFDHANAFLAQLDALVTSPSSAIPSSTAYYQPGPTGTAVLSRMSMASSVPTSAQQTATAVPNLFAHKKPVLKKLRTFMKHIKEHPRHTQISLQAFLILPVQRLPRYRLLLEQLLLCTGTEHRDRHALEKATEEICKRISECNESKRAAEERNLGLSVLSRISIPAMALGNERVRKYSMGRRFLREGAVRVTRVVERVDVRVLPEGSQWMDVGCTYTNTVSGVTEYWFGDMEGGRWGGQRFHWFLFSDLLCWCVVRPDGDYQLIRGMELFSADILDSTTTTTTTGANHGLGNVGAAMTNQTLTVTPAVTATATMTTSGTEGTTAARVRGEGCIVYIAGPAEDVNAWWRCINSRRLL
ncbi:hypothetical protein BC832DRAFT_252789 [Gaertneriomyces semiglobifer]|nr:hypothetical protein BC832DRAFT_252789 [Gaertneriomyces semiglobifer]